MRDDLFRLSVVFDKLRPETHVAVRAHVVETGTTVEFHCRRNLEFKQVVVTDVLNDSRNWLVTEKLPCQECGGSLLVGNPLSPSSYLLVLLGDRMMIDPNNLATKPNHSLNNFRR